MPKVVINNSQGLVQTAGSGLVIDSNVVFTNSPTVSVNSQTTAATLTSAGVYTLSGSSALTWVMPLASSVPGGTFVFRTTSAQAHVLTGSQEANTVKVFAGMPGATPDGLGSRLTFPAVEGSSVALISNGASFMIMAASGSVTLAG